MSIRVLIFRPDGTDAFDVTDRAESLSFSNVNPGGHERCTFTLKGQWAAGFPELRRGNIVRVEDGLQELFTGRVDEHDPQASDAESVGVTAYGVGVRCKDDTMREIYVDRDLSRWTPPSVGRRIVLVAASAGHQDATVLPDELSGQPALATTVHDPWSAAARAWSEAWYSSRGIPIGSLYFAWKKNANVNAADVNWIWQAVLQTDDQQTGAVDATANLRAVGPGTGTIVSTGTRTFASVPFAYGTVAVAAVNTDYSIFWTCLAIYGTHGLAKQGSADATNCQGFFASQIVTDVCSRLTGIQARRIDASSFVIQQLAFLDDVHHEDVIVEVSKFDDVDWGVWGPDTLLGNQADAGIGYLDWTARDSSTATWTVYRDECDEVDLHTEIGSTYDQVAVSYSDPSGTPHRILRTVASPALDEAGIPTRTASLQGGTLTLAGAQQLGDSFLATAAGNPVSRGNISLKGSIAYLDDTRPAHFMRANGSNLYVPDAFPDRDVFALHPTADRRSIFPIKRVTVDCSGDEPVTSVELDQTHDLLSILLARLQVATGIALGGG